MKFSQEQVDDTIIPKMELGNSANLIECFSYVHGHKEAQEVVIDLVNPDPLDFDSIQS